MRSEGQKRSRDYTRRLKTVCGVKWLIHHRHVSEATAATHSELLYKIHQLGQDERRILSDAHLIYFHVRCVCKMSVNECHCCGFFYMLGLRVVTPAPADCCHLRSRGLIGSPVPRGVNATSDVLDCFFFFFFLVRHTFTDAILDTLGFGELSSFSSGRSTIPSPK